MLTWRIHRTLDDPLKRDPISWRGYDARFSRFVAAPRLRLTRFKPVYGAALFAVFSPAVALALAMIFFPSPLLALLASLIFGLRTVEQLSSAIAGEHRRATYELLCALPYGKIGVHWVYAARWFEATRLIRLTLRALPLIALIATPFMFGGWTLPLTGQRAVAFWFADSLAFAVFLIYDYFNTRVIAALIAMLTPALTTRSRTIYAISIGMYLLIQVGTYLLGAVIALVLLPRVLLLFNAPFLASIVIGPFTAAAVIALREVITRILWQQIGYAMQTTPMELDLLIR